MQRISKRGKMSLINATDRYNWGFERKRCCKSGRQENDKTGNKNNIFMKTKKKIKKKNKRLEKK